MAGDVWNFPVLAGRRFAAERVDHPTQKPLSISRRIVKHFSNEGDVVLVPFTGSGSECVAAKQLGRHYVGFDLNPDYIAIAEGRLTSAIEEGNTDLFGDLDR
jgi:site-specific DNA-methyltransferase (adenine-specific)/adenine-specific DNA-methyltransferase